MDHCFCGSRRGHQDRTPGSFSLRLFSDILQIYPHLSLRSRHRGPYIPDPTRCARYTSLTCLCCKTLVYRIHQAVLLNDEVNIKEGPVITKGWAETEPLRSSSGWLEVSSTDVLVSFHTTLWASAKYRLVRSAQIPSTDKRICLNFQSCLE
jgi:hypothetical protein